MLLNLSFSKFASWTYPGSVVIFGYYLVMDGQISVIVDVQTRSLDGQGRGPSEAYTIYLAVDSDQPPVSGPAASNGQFPRWIIPPQAGQMSVIEWAMMNRQ